MDNGQLATWVWLRTTLLRVTAEIAIIADHWPRGDAVSYAREIVLQCRIYMGLESPRTPLEAKVYNSRPPLDIGGASMLDLIQLGFANNNEGMLLVPLWAGPFIPDGTELRTTTGRDLQWEHSMLSDTPYVNGILLLGRFFDELPITTNQNEGVS